MRVVFASLGGLRDQNGTANGSTSSGETQLLGEGVHPKVVQELLGLSSISVTLDTYSHVLPNMQGKAVKAMDSILGGS